MSYIVAVQPCRQSARCFQFWWTVGYPVSISDERSSSFCFADTLSRRVYGISFKKNRRRDLSVIRYRHEASPVIDGC